MTPKYPFKHLAAYEREDKVFYFGREKETSELYQMTFETDLILLYGKSGVGKSSLISCGLANKFKSYEWLEISVRRGSNLNDSLAERLNEKIDEKDRSTDIAEQIRMLRRQYFKPVYLIFDQFEELYISGDEKEQKQFYATVKNILSLNQPVKIIISLREEYLGYLYDFEKAIPQLFSHKCWVQPMKLEVKDENFNIIDEILQGVIDNGEESLVSIQAGDKERLAEGIKQMFRNAGEKTVDLPSLQILFDELYLSLTKDKTFQTRIDFSYNELENKLKENTKDILWNYLNRLVDDLLLKEEQIKSNVVWGLLLELVTEEDTKKSLSEKDLQEKFSESDIDIKQIIDFFKEKKDDNILNKIEQNGKVFWELRHDALAKCIREKLGDVKRLKNLIETKMGEKDDFLTPSQLNEIDKCKDRLFLTNKEKEWIEQNRQKIENEEKAKEAELKKKIKEAKEAEKAKEVELRKKKWQLGITLFTLMIATISLFLAVWKYGDANRAKYLAQKAEEKATVALDSLRVEKLKDLKRRMEDVKSADMDTTSLHVQIETIEKELRDSKNKK